MSPHNGSPTCTATQKWFHEQQVEVQCLSYPLMEVLELSIIQRIWDFSLGRIVPLHSLWHHSSRTEDDLKKKRDHTYYYALEILQYYILCLLCPLPIFEEQSALLKCNHILNLTLQSCFAWLPYNSRASRIWFLKGQNNPALTYMLSSPGAWQTVSLELWKCETHSHNRRGHMQTFEKKVAKWCGRLPGFCATNLICSSVAEILWQPNFMP